MIVKVREAVETSRAASLLEARHTHEGSLSSRPTDSGAPSLLYLSISKRSCLLSVQLTNDLFRLFRLERTTTPGKEMGRERMKEKKKGKKKEE